MFEMATDHSNRHIPVADLTNSHPPHLSQCGFGAQRVHPLSMGGSSITLLESLLPSSTPNHPALIFSIASLWGPPPSHCQALDRFLRPRTCDHDARQWRI